jgi:type I restriction enzyme M protein
MTAPFISGRYVGATAEDEDDEPFEEKMCRLTVKLREQKTKVERLDPAIKAHRRELGFSMYR